MLTKGTGKTKTIISLMKHLMIYCKAPLLVTASTNIAVAEVADRHCKAALANKGSLGDVLLVGTRERVKFVSEHISSIFIQDRADRIKNFLKTFPQRILNFEQLLQVGSFVRGYHLLLGDESENMSSNLSRDFQSLLKTLLDSGEGFLSLTVKEKCEPLISIFVKTCTSYCHELLDLVTVFLEDFPKSLKKYPFSNLKVR